MYVEKKKEGRINMSNTKWTTDQERVIKTRDCNLLVSAAAGSGKTAVLVERIISMVMGKYGNEPIDIDNLLVVTFTRAAAGEMRERVLKALEEASLADPFNEHLRKQTTYIHNAKITTIDSFCADVVREYFSDIDLDPGFKVGDTGELKLMQSDAIAKVLEEYYQSGDKDFFRFVDEYSSAKSDSDVEEAILTLYNFASSYPNPRKWLENLCYMYKEENAGEWLEIIVNSLKEQLNECYNSAKMALELSRGQKFDKYENLLLEEKAYFEQMLAQEDFDKIGKLVKAISFGRMPVMKNLSEADALVKTRISNLRDGYKKAIKKLGTKYFGRSYEDIISDVTGCYPIVKVLVDLTLKFMDEYKNFKMDKDILDFSDLEHYALEILVTEDEEGNYTPTETARAISKDLYEIMIDEYQDSNLVQEIILNAVSGRGCNAPNVFMVGDVKQSIYKFRLARPELFLGKYDTYETIKDDTRDAEREDGKIILSSNFRSRYQVLNFCNMIFKQIMTKELGGISYDKENMLYPEFPYDKGDEDSYKTEILFVDTGADSEEEEFETETDGEESLDKIELEAALIADRIEELVNGNGFNGPLQVYDKSTKGMRDVKYSDIAILFRSTTGFGEVFTQVFMSKGIGVTTSLKDGYFDTFEIGAILDMLSVIDNPRQDIKLASVLRNVFRLSENMLSDIRIGREGSFYEAFYHYDGVYGNLIKDIKDKLNSYREMVSYKSIYDLICYIIEDTCFRQFISAMAVGEKRLANVEMLLEKARAYEDGPYNGLFNFVRYIEKLNKYKVEQGEANVANENDDTVKLMTIHKSKGLEYPVVFVAGMGKKMNMQDVTKKLVIHHELGIGINKIDVEKRLRYKTLLKEAIAHKITLENITEELRVLYVALTRAREKLIITGVGNVTKKLEKYEYLESVDTENYSPSLISSATSYMDFIMMSIIRKIDSHLYDFKPIRPETIVYNKLLKTAANDSYKDALIYWDKDKIYNANLRKEIEDIFSYEYAYKEECSIKSKMSISDIKHMFMKLEYEEEGLTEKIAYEKKNTEDIISSANGALRGNAYHRAFELFDYDKTIIDDSDIEEMLKDISSKGLIGDEEVSLINPTKFSKFAFSTLGQRMKKAYQDGKLYREKPFVMGIPACVIEPDKYKSKELVVVQGIIDAWFIEDGEIVVVDYKTDSVKNIKDLDARYRSQLEYYGKALSDMTGLKVKQLVIYSTKFDAELVL